MYKTIYVPVDNSDHSNTAVDVGVHFAKAFGSKIVGSHVYAAKMHDKRFKQMEAGLPEEYHDEKELDRQRQIHDSLITRGLQIITDSYLDYVDKKCAENNLPIERRSLEGRNWKVLAEDINANAYDLVIMGALGVGAVKDSVIGSNTERVLRRVRVEAVEDRVDQQECEHERERPRPLHGERTEDGSSRPQAADPGSREQDRRLVPGVGVRQAAVGG